MSEILDVKDFVMLWSESICSDDFFQKIPGFNNNIFRKKIKNLLIQGKLKGVLSAINSNALIPNDYQKKILEIQANSTDKNEEIYSYMLEESKIKFKAFDHFYKIYQEHNKNNQLTHQEEYDLLVEIMCFSFLEDLNFNFSTLCEVKDNQLIEKLKDVCQENIKYALGDALTLNLTHKINESREIFFKKDNMISNIDYITKKNNDNAYIEIIKTCLINVLNKHFDDMLTLVKSLNISKEQIEYHSTSFYQYVDELEKKYMITDNLQEVKNNILNKGALSEEVVEFLKEGEELYIINDTQQPMSENSIDKENYFKQKIVVPHVLFDKKMNMKEIISDISDANRYGKNKYAFQKKNEYDFIKNLTINYSFEEENKFNFVLTNIQIEYIIKREYAQTTKKEIVNYILNEINLAKSKSETFSLQNVKDNEKLDILIREIYIKNNLIDKDVSTKQKKKI